MNFANQKLLLAAIFFLWACQMIYCEGLQKGDLVAICGDSITEQKEYSVYIADYLLMCQPAPDLRAMQFGWGGETAGVFLQRLQHDVIPFRPSVATICYGMNDAGYSETKPDRLASYRAALTGIVGGLKKSGIRQIVLGGPGVVDTDAYARDVGPAVYNKTLSDFSDAARQVAAEQQISFADVHATMADAMARVKEKHGSGFHLAGNDGVHPSRSGHLVMAYTFLRALGCRGDIGTITIDQRSGQASATTGHRVISSKTGAITLESTRYPFCFFGAPQDQEGTQGILEFIPFNEELNRFMLVVKNPNSPRLKVTWGESSRDFAAEELLKGINLAAAFPENPFCKPFKNAEEAVREQQKMDSYLVKEFLHWTPGWSHLLPGNEASFGRLEASVVERSKIAVDATGSAIVPVNHTILIEGVH